MSLPDFTDSNFPNPSFAALDMSNGSVPPVSRSHADLEATQIYDLCDQFDAAVEARTLRGHADIDQSTTIAIGMYEPDWRRSGVNPQAEIRNLADGREVERL